MLKVIILHHISRKKGLVRIYNVFKAQKKFRKNMTTRLDGEGGRMGLGPQWSDH